MNLQALNPALISGVNDQLKSNVKFYSTSGEVLEYHSEVVEGSYKSLEEQQKVIKKTSFNMEKFNSNLKEGGNAFSDGVKELTGGLVDFGGMFETVGKKFKAVGDIGRGIASPVTSLFKGFEKDEDDLEGQDQQDGDMSAGEDGEKPGLDDLVDEKDLKEKKKLDKENNKQTKTQNENLKKSGKGFKGMLRGIGMLSLKFLLIVGVVALLVVGFMKLISALSDNGGLQAVFDFISNIIGRVRNAFDAVILGLDTAISYIPGLDGFLSKEEREEKEGRMRDRTAQRAFKKQRADDSDEVAAIRARIEKENPGMSKQAIDARVDTEAMEKGLITDRMFLANEEERAAGMKGVLIEGKDGIMSAGEATNMGFLQQAVKETGDEEYREKMIGDLTDDPEKAKTLIADANADSQQLIKALSMIDDKERVQKLVDRAKDRYDNAMEKFGPEDDRTIDAYNDLQAQVQKLSVIQSYLDNFKAVTGDDAEEVLEKMKMGKGSDEFGKGEKGYFSFDPKDFEREFNEYAATKENVAEIDRDQAYQFDERNLVDARYIDMHAEGLEKERNLTDEQRAQYQNQVGFGNMATIHANANQYTETYMSTINNSNTSTTNVDIKT